MAAQSSTDRGRKHRARRDVERHVLEQRILALEKNRATLAASNGALRETCAGLVGRVEELTARTASLAAEVEAAAAARRAEAARAAELERHRGRAKAQTDRLQKHLLTLVTLGLYPCIVYGRRFWSRATTTLVDDGLGLAPAEWAELLDALRDLAQGDDLVSFMVGWTDGKVDLPPLNPGEPTDGMAEASLASARAVIRDVLGGG